MKELKNFKCIFKNFWIFMEKKKAVNYQGDV